MRGSPWTRPREPGHASETLRTVLDVGLLDGEVHRRLHAVQAVEAAFDLRRTRCAAHAAQLEIGGRHAANYTPRGYIVQGAVAEDTGDMTLTRADERLAPAERKSRALRRLRRAPGAPPRGAAGVHPRAVAQHVLHVAPGRGEDLLRRPRLRTRLRHAGRHLSSRRGVRRQRPGHGVSPAHHGGRRRHRDPRTAGRRREAGRSRPGLGDRHQPVAGRALAGQPQQLARTLARLHLGGHRGPGGCGPRDRQLGRAPLHVADPDQGRTPAVVGRSEIRPDLGRPPPDTTSP